MTEKPLILISNDDGVHARGLHHLINIANRFGDVIAVAPDRPRSGQSAALTVNSPLEIVGHDPIGTAKVYSVTGTPVDCIKLALHAITPRRPDLVLSGINHGSNAAVNNIYSGTMGAAMEACLAGIPAIGYSILNHSPQADFEPLTEFIEAITERVLEKGLPQDICLNVNFPKDCRPQGVKVLRAAAGHWTEEYADYTDPHGRPFYWLTGRFHNEEPDAADTDEYWLARGFGSIVPIRPGQTAIDMIERVKGLF